jgi:hypothetical protein
MGRCAGVLIFETVNTQVMPNLFRHLIGHAACLVYTLLVGC